MGKIERIQVPPEDRERLDKLVKDRNTPQKVVWRARIVMLAGDGTKAGEIARTVGKSVVTVRRWRRRYAARGVDGLLKDATRPPGRKPLSARKIKQVVDLTLHEKPPNATHWSVRVMAARVGIAPSAVHKIWRAHGLKPHLTQAASDAHLQALARSELRRQGRGHRRSLPQPAGQSAGALGRREIANPGARPYPAGTADEEGPLRDDDARLSAPWHHHPVCGAQHA